MENIIEALIQIEEKADDTIQKVMKEKETLPARIQDEIARRKAEIDKKSEDTVKTRYNSQATECEQKIRRISLDNEHKTQAVEEAFVKHREQWRAALFSRIVGDRNPDGIPAG